MTAYRFRVKFEPDPTSLWRDIVVGAERTIEEFQSVVNPAFGLDDGHLWFVGTDERFWNSDVKYQCSQQFEESLRGAPIPFGEQTYNAGTTTIGKMIQQGGLDQYDRICYLYDYGDEWRFYAILKEILNDESSDKGPEVVNEKGDTLDQYALAKEENSPLPEPLDTFPDTAIPTADLRALEDREDVTHVIVLLSIETGYGTVTERFMIQYEDTGYLLENVPHGWEIIEKIDGKEKTEEELLGALADAARDWHAEITMMVEAASGQFFDEGAVAAMNVELEYELEQRGYDHL